MGRHMLSKTAIMRDLQRWGEAQKRKKHLDAAVMEVVAQSDTGLLAQATALLEELRNRTIRPSSRAECEAAIQAVEQWQRQVATIQKALDQANEYLTDWSQRLSGLPSRHRRLLEKVYRDGDTLDQISRDMHLDRKQAEKLHRQSLNLLRSIG